MMVVIVKRMKSRIYGKYYNTDVVDNDGMFRIIESIPSKNAEPIIDPQLTDVWALGGIESDLEYAIFKMISIENGLG